MRQKFRKAVAALSRGQLFRNDQTIAFDFVEPDNDPNVIGACCTDSDGDGTFCDCESNVTARDCCLQKGIHSPGLTCDGEAGGVVVCCDPDPPFVGCCIPGQAQCITVREDVCAQLGGVSYSGGCSGVECGCNGAWCCDDGNSIRTCTEASQYQPPDGGYGICNFQGCNTTCADTDCGFIPRTGACCGKCGQGTDNPNNLDGSCSQSTEEECAALGGQYNGDGSECHYYACFSEGECNDPKNSCCAHNPDTGLIECTQVLDASQCDGIYTEGGDCANNPCAGLLQTCCCTGYEYQNYNCPIIDNVIPQVCLFDYIATALVFDPAVTPVLPDGCDAGGLGSPTDSIDCSCGGGIGAFGTPGGGYCYELGEQAREQCQASCGTSPDTFCLDNGIGACNFDPNFTCPSP